MEAHVRGVGVQGEHQRRSVQDQANPRVAMTVDPPLVTLGQAKPPLQIEIIPDRFILLLADEQAGVGALHGSRGRQRAASTGASRDASRLTKTTPRRPVSKMHTLSLPRRPPSA